MKMIYIISTILFVGLIVFLVSCQNKPAEDTSGKTAKTEIIKPKENAYEGLRNMALHITPEQLNLKLSADKIEVYGIIMDWEMNGAVATTAAYSTGDASMYTSTGGGVIGGGQHQNVNSAAKQLIILAQSFVDKATKTETTPLPQTNTVKFYFLTNKGFYSCEEVMSNFENSSSKWLKLFEEANNVLTELRKTSEK